MARRPAHLLGMALFSFACSLVVDTAEIDAGCGSGMKICGGACVRIDDPAYGCTVDRCEPCKDGGGNQFGARRIPKCEENRCVTETCAFGFSSADCSVPVLTDPNNCGTSGNVCEVGEVCLIGVCRVPDDGAGGAGGEGGGGN